MQKTQSAKSGAKSTRSYNLDRDVIAELHRLALADGRPDSSYLNVTLRKVLKLNGKGKN